MKTVTKRFLLITLILTTIINLAGPTKTLAKPTALDQFFRLDKNGDKVIDAKEISALRRAKLRNRVRELDLNSDGDITYQEAVDGFIKMRLEIAKKIGERIFKGLKKHMIKKNYQVEALQSLPCLKKNSLNARSFDQNANGSFEQHEIEKLIPELMAIVFAKRIRPLAELIGKAPQDAKEERLRRTAQLMDYNADMKISREEFDAFLSKALGEKAAKVITEQEPATNLDMQVSRQVAAKNSSFISDDGNNNHKERSTQKSSVYVTVPEATGRMKTPDKYLIPRIDKLAGKLNQDKDPLQELLEVDSREEVLW